LVGEGDFRILYLFKKMIAVKIKKKTSAFLGTSRFSSNNRLKITIWITGLSGHTHRFLTPYGTLDFLILYSYVVVKIIFEIGRPISEISKIGILKMTSCLHLALFWEQNRRTGIRKL